MAMGDLHDLLSKIVNLDARLREAERLKARFENMEMRWAVLEDRVAVMEENTINHENRLQDLEEDDDE